MVKSLTLILYILDSWSYEVKTYETFEESEEIEEIVEDYEEKRIVARERQVIESDKVVLTEQTVTSSHDDTIVHSSTEQTVTQERSAGAATGSEASSTLSQAQFEAIAYAEAEAARRRSGGGASSNADIEKEKSTFCKFFFYLFFFTVICDGDVGDLFCITNGCYL